MPSGPIFDPCFHFRASSHLDTGRKPFLHPTAAQEQSAEVQFDFYKPEQTACQFFSW
jgi:hypothetical protein